MIINMAGGGGSSSVVNAVLSEYKSSGADIAPNTFVEFVGAGITWGAETTVSSATASGYRAKAAALDDNTVVFTYETGSSSSWQMDGQILKFSGGTITVGEVQTVNSYSATKDYCVIPMSANTAVCYGGYGSQNYARHFVMTVSGDTISTSGSGSESSRYIGTGVSGCKVSDTAFIITTRTTASSGAWYAYGYALSGSTISSKTSKSLGSATTHNNYVYLAASVQMSDGVALVFGAGSSSYPTALVAQADSSNTFTFGNATAVGSAAARYFRLVRISDTKALAIYGEGSSTTLPIYAVVLTISGTTVTAGTAVQLSASAAGAFVAAAYLGDGYCLALVDSNAVILKVDGTTITTVSTTATSMTAYTSGDRNVVLFGNGVLAAYGTAANANAYSYGDVDFFIKESADKIDGLTKEKCTSAVAGDVWVLQEA